MKKVARADGFLLMNRLGLLTLGYFSFVWLSIGRDSDSARTSRSVPLCGSFFYYYYCKIIIILVPFSFPVLLFDWRVGPAVHCFRLKRTHSVTIRRICRGETSPSVARRLVFDKIIFSSPLKKPTDVIHQAGSQKPQLSGALIRVDADRIPFHLVRRRKKQASVNLFKSFGFVLFLFFWWNSSDVCCHRSILWWIGPAPRVSARPSRWIFMTMASRVQSTGTSQSDGNFADHED